MPQIPKPAERLILESDFNYVVTVHNKEALLPDVLSGVEEAASEGARVIIVLDGCTDGSAAVAERFQAGSTLDVQLVEAPDVHEVKAINIGLRQTRPGYCIILQDDVVLCEPNLENMIRALCDDHNGAIGFISLRLATNLKPTSIADRLKWFLRTRRVQYLSPMTDDHQTVAAKHEHLDVAKVPYGVFVPRMVGIKSPVCITPELRRLEPLLDEQFAPYCYDDYDLSIRSLRAGLVNGLFAVHFKSELEWGGTRQDSTFSSAFGASIRLRNRRLLWKKHRTFLRNVKGVSAW